jgi:hypothetical protein
MPSLEVITIVVVDQDFRIRTDPQCSQHATPSGAIGRRLSPSQRLERLRAQPDGADDVTGVVISFRTRVNQTKCWVGQPFLEFLVSHEGRLRARRRRLIAAGADRRRQ